MGRKRTGHRRRPPGIAAPVAPHATPAPPARIATALWYLGGLLTFWSFGYTIAWGADLWWHLAAGRFMVDHRAFLHLTDPWSYTRAGLPWLHHEWLSDVIFHGWSRLLGMQSLAYWKWGLIAGTYLLLMHSLRRLTGSPAAGYLGALAAVAVAAPFLDVRPHLYSLLGFALVIHLTVGRERPPWFLTLVFCVWANLHGGFFFGLMALAAVAAPYALGGGKAELMRAALLWLACVAACLFTPNGLEAFYYPIKYAFDTSSPFRTLAEWKPPFEPGGMRSALYPYAIAAFTASALVVLLVRDLRRNLHVSLSGLSLGLLTLAMSLRSRRFIVLFAMAQALVLAPVFAHALRWVLQRAPRPAPSRWRPLVAPALAIGLGILWLRPYPVTPYAFHYLTNEGAFPVEALNFIEDNHISGKVFGYYNWGGYIHLRTDGRLKVYIDGRADTVYDADTYHHYLTVLHAQPGWREVIEGPGAELVLWPKNRGRILSELVETGRWRLLYEDFVSQLLVRVDAALPAPLRATRPSAWRELALGDAAAGQMNLPEAERRLKRSLEIAPYLGEACYLLARVQAAEGKVDDARATLRRCERTYPDPSKRFSIEVIGLEAPRVFR